ncbi:hypothetical protein D3C79_813100 [compost metagenome]
MTCWYRHTLVDQIAQLALLVNVAEQYKGTVEQWPGKAQVFLAIGACRHQCQISLALLHRVDNLGEATTAGNHFKMQAGT